MFAFMFVLLLCEQNNFASFPCTGIVLKLIYNVQFSDMFFDRFHDHNNGKKFKMLYSSNFPKFTL